MNPARFLAIHDFSGWTRSQGSSSSETLLVSEPLDAGLAWDQLIISWNAETPADSYLKVEARGCYPDHTTRYYVLGLWSNDPEAIPFHKDVPSVDHPRESVNGQKDSDGDVHTDTLVLARPCTKVQVRLTVGSSGTQTEASPPKIKSLGLCFLDSRSKPGALEPQRAAWGKVIEVPERAQGTYPNGGVICSPTCTSMTMAYWAKSLHRPELDKDVPEVVKGVYDRVWGGTGNWPFNTAYAGAMPGMRAYVSRFIDIAELEEWIAAGLPVVCSVSYTALRGKHDPDPSGHLVVCVGFTPDGDIILNDPALNPRRGLRVRSPYPRQQFIAAWADSHNTVYLIYPESARLPAARYGHWEQK